MIDRLNKRCGGFVPAFGTEFDSVELLKDTTLVLPS